MKASVNGVDLHYTFDGPEHAPVVMMSHSLMCSTAMWDAQIPALGDYRVLRLDTRGHGASGSTGDDYTLEQLTDDCIALLDHLEIERVHFVGLSLGGMIGQTLALKSADRLISLTLSSTMSELPAGAASVWDERIAMAKAKGMAGLVPATIERWFSEDFCLEHGEQVEPIRELMQATSIDGFAGCCRAISRLDLTGLLPALKTPTLVIVGEHDPGTPVSAAERIQQNIPGSELVVIDGALHLCNVEKPEVFNAALTAFLAKH